MKIYKVTVCLGGVEGQDFEPHEFVKKMSARDEEHAHELITREKWCKFTNVSKFTEKGVTKEVKRHYFVAADKIHSIMIMEEEK